ncbi:hypothetical protein V3M78_01650 [Trueperella pyogenes]|uniref:hypothetical protein n=1 Tax=Trueperella pyogenes TaxID=1661 RepID=UPI00043AC408|nr:hypothetical protein [Trueperella pyogenes]AHU90581.1 hypothetical protein CQ11_08125 [Trueperella pyogenes]OQD35494.1 hypothetical protein B1R42_08470 [Trueperella pyogenes]
MLWGKNLNQLRRELEVVNQKIADNPLSAPEISEATELIESLKETDRESEIETELAKRGLPNSEEIGKVIFQHSLTLARLNKKRLKLEKKIGKTG